MEEDVVVVSENTEGVVVPSDHSEEILEEIYGIKEILADMTTEEVTEEVTEEIIDIDPSALPVTSGEYNEGVNTINENLGEIASGIERTNELLAVSSVEEDTGNSTEEITEHELIYGSGTVADGTLYFADKVDNANLNDLYSMVWSVRNTLLIFMFLLLFVLIFKTFKNLIYRFTN